MDEIDAGIYDSLTYSDIKKNIQKNRKNDKLNYRYPRGESYKDLIVRAQKMYMILKIVINPSNSCSSSFIKGYLFLSYEY